MRPQFHSTASQATPSSAVAPLKRKPAKEEKKVPIHIPKEVQRENKVKQCLNNLIKNLIDQGKNAK